MSENMFEGLPSRAIDFFGRYLSAVAAANIDVNLSSRIDKAVSATAQVTTRDCTDFAMIISEGLLELFAKVYAAIASEEATMDGGIFRELITDLKSRFNVRVSKGATDPVASLGEVLRMAYFNTVVFVGFHEFSHIRAGHFNYLFSLDTRHPGRKRQLKFSECQETGLFSTEAADERHVTYPPFIKQLEVEADILGFSTLLGVTMELLLDEIPADGFELFSVCTGPADGESDALTVCELALYATCICLSLFEVERKQTGGRSRYPRPFTRILAIFRQFIVSTVGSWQTGGGEDGSEILASVSASKMDRYSDIFYQAIALCNFSCEVSGLILPKRYRLTSESDFVSDAFILGGLLPQSGALQTMEANELISLDGAAPRYRRKMRKFRIQPWDLLRS